jgi:hypothetical protein
MLIVFDCFLIFRLLAKSTSSSKTSNCKKPKTIPILKRMLALVTCTTSLANNDIKTYFQEPIVAADTDVLS